MNEPLRHELLRERPMGTIGAKVFALSAVGSTNDVAWEMIAAGAARHGDAVFAESQDLGRGRGANRWFSPPCSGLLFSVVLRPAVPPDRTPWITQAAGLAVALAARKFGADAKVKWPNDVLVGGAKLCGILTEARTAHDGSTRVVLGIGINVLARPGDFPSDLRGIATSLYMATGVEHRREEVLDAVLNELGEAIGTLDQGKIAELDRRISGVSALLGRKVRLISGDETAEGTVVEQTLEKGIVLELPGGSHAAFFGPHVRSLEFL